MTRNQPMRYQQSHESLREDQPTLFNGFPRTRPSSDSLRRSYEPRDPLARYQQASAEQSRVTSVSAETQSRLQRSPVMMAEGEQWADEADMNDLPPMRGWNVGPASYNTPAHARPLSLRTSALAQASQCRWEKSPVIHVMGETKESVGQQSTEVDPAEYTEPFLKFMTENPTVFHAVEAFGSRLKSHGFKHISERDEWDLKAGGKYFITRNGSGLVAFVVGKSWKPGNGGAFIASHVDALTTKVKPVSTKPTKQGYQQLGIAHYGGALSSTWVDRDLSLGGRVFVRDSKTGKIEQKLMKIGHPIARIPGIAPHFGLPAEGQPNRETRMVPIVGLDNSDIHSYSGASQPPKDSSPEYGFGFSAFAKTQPPRLVKAVAKELDVSPADIVNWELEVYSSEAATLLGLDKELISAGRIDDKMCAFAAVEALLSSDDSASDNILKVVGLFDDEEVGSLLRQGANSNFLPGTVERINEAFGGSPSAVKRTFAKSFLISADVCHAYNPNYDDVYMVNHTPRLNVGVAISFDSNAHMTTDGISSTILASIAEKSGSTLQPFQIRNDSRSGGTVGPMLSSATGMRAVDAGIPQLAMHSIRATTGSLDPGLGVKLFKGFFDHYQTVDAEVAQE